MFHNQGNASDIQNSPFQKGRALLPLVKEELYSPLKGKSFTPPCKGKSFTPPCKGGRGDFQRCSKGVTLISLENEPSFLLSGIISQFQEERVEIGLR